MNNNYENLPAVLNATQLASALGISRAGAYQLLHTEDFPERKPKIQRRRLLLPETEAITVLKRIYTIHIKTFFNIEP